MWQQGSGGSHFDTPCVRGPSMVPPNNTNRSNQGARTRDTGVPSEVPSTSWEGMDDVNLEGFLVQKPWFSSRTFPPLFLCGFAGKVQRKMAGDAVAEERAWKLFGLIPVVLLHRPQGCGSVGKQELAERANKFGRGRWRELLASS